MVLLGYVQNIIMGNGEEEEGRPDEVQAIKDIFANQEVGNVQQKYFLDSARANQNQKSGYPAWMSFSDAELLQKSTSIQVLLGNIGILAEEMARQCEPHRHIGKLHV